MALLTIAIPTYNRATYLDRCLTEIGGQVAGAPHPIEVIVSDNCSTDNTADVVQRHRDRGLPIRYFRNEENRGPDFNIARCYSEAAGKYVVAFGDDDVWLPGSIHAICDLLAQGEWGVVHLKSQVLRPDYTETAVSGLAYKTYTNPGKFAKKINIFVTFITGNIVNRKFMTGLDLDPFLGTNLIQVPLFLSAIYGGLPNIYINNPTIAAEVDNSGGYNLFKVFGINFPIILREFKTKQPVFPLGPVLDDLVIGFLPHWIIKFRQNNLNTYKHESPYRALKDVHRGNPFFWLVDYPLFFLPVWVLKPYQMGAKALNRTRRALTALM